MRILGIAGGAFGIFIGLAVIAPRLVRPLAHVVGLPAARLGGAAGRLAQENAIRNPGRTASTAAALMIGLTLVSFVAVFGKGLLASDESALRKQLGTSHVITSQSGWDAVPLGAGEAAAKAPGVVVSSSIRGDQVQVVGDGEKDVSGVDPATIARAYKFEWVEGGEASLATLTDGGAIVREGDGHVGDTLGLRHARRQGRLDDRPRRLQEARRPRPAARERRPLAADVRRQLPAAGRHAHARARPTRRARSSARWRRSRTRSCRRATSSSPAGRRG